MMNYGFYAGPAPMPEWMRAERFDYCEKLGESMPKGGSIVSFIRKLFK